MCHGWRALCCTWQCFVRAQSPLRLRDNSLILIAYHRDFAAVYLVDIVLQLFLSFVKVWIVFEIFVFCQLDFIFVVVDDGQKILNKRTKCPLSSQIRH
jgi:hypothetical protein